jgi:hypothetical protein
MRVASLGHAALFVETRDQRILIDPVFSQTLKEGAVGFTPERRFKLDRMPVPTVLVVTHSHFDHFHPPTLEGMDRDLPVVVPEDPRLLQQLTEMGFRRLITLAPWQQIEIGSTRFVATPSAHHEPEFGVVVRDEDGAFWDMVDSEVTRGDGARLARRFGRVDVVAAKYQPAERSSMGYLRTRGARFDKAEVVGWLEAACAVDPGFVFPHASGFCFTGRHAWFNRIAFPFSPEEIADLLGRRLGRHRAGVVQPGDVVEILAGRPPACIPQSCPFVSSIPMGSASVAWEPVDVSTLPGVDEPSERVELAARLDRFMNENLQPWLHAEMGRDDSPLRRHRSNGVVWQLVVEAGRGERIEWFIDYTAPTPSASPGRHAFANDFTHVAGRTLLEVLRGEAPGFFWLVGDARSYEKTIGLAHGRLFAPPVTPATEDELGDPVTFFLRHFGATGTGRPMAPDGGTDLPPDQDDIDVMARQGASPAVLAKKVLMCVLATREAARLGISPTESDVQRASDVFRQRFGLEDADEMQAWLGEVGLDLSRYSRAMYGFAAVTRTQAHWSGEIDRLLDDFARVASVRERDR